eukprot:1765146-Amphidinium_carterae.1
MTKNTFVKKGRAANRRYEHFFLNGDNEGDDATNRHPHVMLGALPLLSVILTMPRMRHCFVGRAVLADSSDAEFVRAEPQEVEKLATVLTQAQCLLALHLNVVSHRFTAKLRGSMRELLHDGQALQAPWTRKRFVPRLWHKCLRAPYLTGVPTRPRALVPLEPPPPRPQLCAWLLTAHRGLAGHFSCTLCTRCCCFTALDGGRTEAANPSSADPPIRDAERMGRSRAQPVRGRVLGIGVRLLPTTEAL